MKPCALITLTACGVIVSSIGLVVKHGWPGLLLSACIICGCVLWACSFVMLGAYLIMEG